MELRTTHKELPHPDRVIVHRKGVPGNEEEEHLAHELRCYPNTAQVRKSRPPCLGTSGSPDQRENAGMVAQDGPEKVCTRSTQVLCKMHLNG